MISGGSVPARIGALLVEGGVGPVVASGELDLEDLEEPELEDG